jgi:hypothetical protein
MPTSGFHTNISVFTILKYFLFDSVFQICDILIRIWILGSVYLITDPDPALFGTGFQDAKNIFFKFLFAYLRYFLPTIDVLTPVFKDNMLPVLKSQKHRNHGLS